MAQIKLNRVEIPGLADAYRKERGLRNASFGNCTRRIGPFTVRLMTLRDLCWLDAEGNKWVSGKPFKTRGEGFTDALALIWHLSLSVRMPENGESVPTGQAIRMLARKLSVFVLGAFLDEQKLMLDVAEYLQDRFYDAPKNGGNRDSEMERSFAAGPASVVDLFAAGGYALTENEILDMPLDRIWQYGRLIADRLGGNVANPSDWVKSEYLEKRQKGVV